MKYSLLCERRVRRLLLENKFTLGPHAQRRIMESGITNAFNIIHELAKCSFYSRTSSNSGHCVLIVGYFDGVEHRLVVGTHLFEEDALFIITFFTAKTDKETRQYWKNYQGIDLEFTFNSLAMSA